MLDVETPPTLSDIAPPKTWPVDAPRHPALVLRKIGPAFQPSQQKED